MMKISGLYRLDGLHIAKMSVLKRKLPISYNPNYRQYQAYGQFFVLNEEAIAFKKVISLNNRTSILATLMIPAGAIVFLTDGPHRDKKCRASEALVLRLESISSGLNAKRAYSFHDRTFTYQAGQYIIPKEIWRDKPHTGCLMSEEYEECKSGIHFFRSVSEAVCYLYY